MDYAKNLLEQAQESISQNTVKYIQSDITKMPLDSASVDMAMSMRVLHHIKRPEDLFSEIHRILKPNGYFCLDTPNRYLTELLVPNGFIHPEHKREYYPKDLLELAQEEGFQLVESKAISPMPKTAKSRIFNFVELALSDHISSEVNEGYSFYLKLKKI